ncbi:MAG: thioesterase [Symploca sp. SIO2G7]|nr:thioesterase [Symploca sp. SIO2G7]
MTTTQTSKSWVIFPRPNTQAKLRLFCFHYSGGGASSFRTWTDLFPPYVEVCLIELPGRGSRFMEPLFTQLKPLIQQLSSAILPHLNKPFAFFGHSMGALVSFELARLLSSNYQLAPCHLFVSGRFAPQVPDPDPPIHALPEPEFIEELRRYNGTPEEVLNNTELMQVLIPILRADFTVLETYIYTPAAPLNVPITAFGGLQDRKASREDLEAWQEQTNSNFSLQMFPGDHFFIHSDESLLLGSLTEKLHQIVKGMSY